MKYNISDDRVCNFYSKIRAEYYNYSRRYNQTITFQNFFEWTLEKYNITLIIDENDLDVFFDLTDADLMAIMLTT